MPPTPAVLAGLPAPRADPPGPPVAPAVPRAAPADGEVSGLTTGSIEHGVGERNLMLTGISVRLDERAGHSSIATTLHFRA
jgi:hypothetical protein